MGRFHHRQSCHVDDAARGGGWRQDVGGKGRSEQDRPDMQAVRHGLDDAERDVGGIEIGEDEQVCLAGQGAVGHDAAAQRIGDGGIAVHLAVGLQTGRLLADDFHRPAHLEGAFGIARAEA